MPSKKIPILFIISLLCSYIGFSQSLNLKAIGETNRETTIIDSIGYQKKFNDFSSLQSEVDALSKKITNIGYIDFRLKNIEKVSDTSYTVKFELNRPYETIRLFIKDSSYVNVLKLFSDYKHEGYLEIPIGQLETFLQQFNSEIANLGDPFASIQLEEIQKINEKVIKANIIIKKQRSRTIDAIIVKGYEKFPKTFIKHYLSIKRNQPFNLTVIKDKMSDLENLQFANQIKDPEVLFTKDSTLLYMYLQKQQSNTFDGYLGFGTNTETNKIEFNGYLNLNLVNNLNYGEVLKLVYKSDESEQKTFDVKVKIPYLFGTPLGTELGLNIFKKDSSFISVSQFAQINYQINSKNQFSVGINSTNSNSLLDLTNTNIIDHQSTFYTFNYLHTRSQKYSALFPLNFFVNFSSGFGNRRIDSEKVSQTKFDLNAFKIFNLNEKNSIYTGIISAVLLSDNFIENELFRFGGINSIRGFEENSLLADFFTVINTEYRYQVSNTLYVNSVLDFAYFENKLIDVKSKLYGFGLGFGLLTKAGLFNFNYSSGKIEDQPFKLSDSKIHISLTADF